MSANLQDMQAILTRVAALERQNRQIGRFAVAVSFMLAFAFGIDVLHPKHAYAEHSERNFAAKLGAEEKVIPKSDSQGELNSDYEQNFAKIPTLKSKLDSLARTLGLSRVHRKPNGSLEIDPAQNARKRG